MKAFRGYRDITSLILKLVTRVWNVVNFTLRPLYPREKLRYPLNRRLVGPKSRCGRCQGKRKLFFLPG
jgi:hypothetical protein